MWMPQPSAKMAQLMIKSEHEAQFLRGRYAATSKGARRAGTAAD